jgi:hypothetical protein
MATMDLDQLQPSPPSGGGNRMRAYVMQLGLSLLLLLGAALVVSYIGISPCISGGSASCGLVHFQKEKVQSLDGPIDTVFFGDSSLGNAVDAAQFQQLRGRPSLNLALNGGMGLPVIYLQMKDTFEQIPVRNAVIMVTPAQFRHRFKHGAILFAAAAKADPGSLLGTSWHVVLPSVISTVKLLFDGAAFEDGLAYLFFNREDHGDCPGCQETDYVRQSDKSVAPGLGDLTVWKGPYRDYDPFLKRIADLCRDYAVNCLYMHGPLMEDAMELNPDYASLVDRHINRAGLKLVSDQPIVIPDEEVGNAVNHVQPQLRPIYTERIFKDLQPFLR